MNVNITPAHYSNFKNPKHYMILDYFHAEMKLAVFRYVGAAAESW